ncbi:UNVERIFIED_CONTAM: ATP-dependent RNA helicase dbp6 [Siphonaria sp. JEL0065]|nr:ATP-dependent RNA helicase dbp6 [Siphonaria sp. JEL0065]
MPNNGASNNTIDEPTFLVTGTLTVSPTAGEGGGVGGVSGGGLSTGNIVLIVVGVFVGVGVIVFGAVAQYTRGRDKTVIVVDDYYDDIEDELVNDAYTNPSNGTSSIGRSSSGGISGGGSGGTSLNAQQQLERYGEEKRPTPAPTPAPERTRAAETKRPEERIDWRELKQRKKKWAADLERERDLQMGLAVDLQLQPLPAHPETEVASSGPYVKKRSRGGNKHKAKKVKLDLESATPNVVDDQVDGEEAVPELKMDHEVGIIGNETKDLPDEENQLQIVQEEQEVEEEVDPNSFLFAETPQKHIKKSNLKAQGLPQWLANPTRIPATLSIQTPESSTANPAYNLSKHTQARLASLDIHHLFPVQQAVLPKLLLSRYSSSPRTPPGDLLVSSATGSGKTLAYVLPILEYLISNPLLSSTATARVIPRLRALIVVPTRDLAVQVKTTLEQVSKGSSIRIGVVTGSMSFHAEQEMLVETGGRDVGTEGVLNEGGRCCKVDVLVATPGRLTDHLKGTPGFSLRHLRFLVLDEADRLLVQDYQGWLNMVLKGVKEDLINSDGVALVDEDGGIAAHSKSRYDRYLASGCCSSDSTSKSDTVGQEWKALGFKVDELGMPLHNVVSLRHEQVQQLDDGQIRNKNGTYTIRHHTPLQKLLFSATLTRNPEKIASLHLTNPSYIAVSSAPSTLRPVKENGHESSTDNQDQPDTQDAAHEEEDLSIEKYNAPPTLSEHMIVVDSTSSKPLILLHLLFNLQLSGLLIFTKSVESAHRLASLIESVNTIVTTSVKIPITARAISSDLSTSDRKKLITSFSKGEITALVCSDVMARGMDLGQSVKGVVNYDVPSSGGGVKTYVHRVGRTARAGRDGEAWSIVEEKEARWFKREVVGLVTRAEGKSVVRVKVGETETAGRLKLAYKRALEQLAALVKGITGQVEL